MKNRVLALFLAALVAVSATACGSSESEKAVPTVTVSGILPEKGDLIVSTTYIGTVEPKQSITVYPMVSGNVTDLNAILGKQVKKGDVLFHVDSTGAAELLAEAEKELAAVKKEAEEAKKEAEKAEKEAAADKKTAAAAKVETLAQTVKTKKTALEAAEKKRNDAKAKRDALDKESSSYNTAQKEYEKSKSELADAQTAYDKAVKEHEDAKKAYDETYGTSKNNSTFGNKDQTNSASTTTQNIIAAYDEKIAAAEKKVNEVKILVDMHQMKAPFDGVVEAVYIREDQKVFEDTPCVVVSNVSNMEVFFQVSEEIANTLHTGELVQVEKNGGMNQATITEIARIPNPDTQLFTIKASLGAVSGFSTGTSVKVHAETKKALDVMKIPYDALYFQSGSAYVYCIEDDEAVRKEVQVGLMNDESAEILEGLTEEDVVISTWSSQLKDGAEVNLLFVIGYSEEEPEEVPGEGTPEVDGTEEEAPKEEYTWVLPKLD